MHSSKFERPGSCDLLICDEAHRLKNDQTLTNKVHQFVMFILYTQFICSLGSTPALSLLKALKSIMCRHWLPFLVHVESSCPVPQCRYFLVPITPPPPSKKRRKNTYAGTIYLKFDLFNIFWCCRMIWKNSFQWWISQILGFWGMLHISADIMKYVWSLKRIRLYCQITSYSCSLTDDQYFHLC